MTSVPRAALILSFAILFFSACTITIKPPAEPFNGYGPRKEIPLRVQLVILEDFRAAKWERGDYEIPIGPSLVENARTLTKHVFLQTTDGAAVNPSASPDAVLTPRLVYITRTIGATSFGDSIIAIKLEWTLTRPGGVPIWVHTASGEARGSTGWTKPEKVLAEAIEDLMRKSHDALRSSRAIQQFAAARPSQVTEPMTKPNQ